jgi:hypothetical protein
LYSRLGEGVALYKALFEVENEDIGFGNSYFWDLKAE